MDKEEAITQIGNDVYKAASIAEKLERSGDIVGNGHHIAQDIAKYAQDKIRERWVDRNTGKDENGYYRGYAAADDPSVSSQKITFDLSKE